MMQVRCKVCDVGELTQIKKYRMSGPVVFIGYVLLVPSIIGVSLSVIMFIMSLFLAANHNVGGVAAVVGMVYVFIGIFAMVGGLLGWLLIMKKRVLQCNMCGAAVNLA